MNPLTRIFRARVSTSNADKAEPLPWEELGLKGGQGRSDAEARWASTVLVTVAILSALFALVLGVVLATN